MVSRPFFGVQEAGGKSAAGPQDHAGPWRPQHRWQAGLHPVARLSCHLLLAATLGSLVPSPGLALESPGGCGRFTVAGSHPQACGWTRSAVRPGQLDFKSVPGDSEVQAGSRSAAQTPVG